MPNQQAVVLTREMTQWRDRIESAWKRSVESVVEVGRLINEARDQLGATYAILETELPFSTTVASFLSKIARNPVLSDPANFSRLPNGVNTLYHLTFVDERALRDQLRHGEVTPDTTLNEAKALRTLTLASPDASNSQKQANNTSSLVEVGTISIAVPKNLDRFADDLAALLAKYEGQLTLSKGPHSLYESHRRALHDAALSQIALAEDGMAKVDLETIHLLEDAIHFLSKDKKGKFRKSLIVDGKTEEHSCLPDDYPNLRILRKMLGTTDIYRSALMSYCKNNKILVRYIDLKNVDKEFYIWEQMRLYTSGKDTKGAIKRLSDLASYSPHANIKRLAKKTLAELSRFQ